MAHVCPRCGLSKGFDYYLYRILGGVLATGEAWNILESQLHVWETIKVIISRLSG